MSRSYRKVAGGGITTARTDKWFKVQEHRRYRGRIRTLIMSGEDEIFPIYGGDYGNPWASPKDGHGVWYWSLQDYLRKTPETWEFRRTGALYTPIWADRQFKRIEVHKRPTTPADYKKILAK